MSLAWLLNDKRITSVLIGASSVSQLKDNLAMLNNLDFSENEIKMVNELSAPAVQEMR